MSDSAQEVQEETTQEPSYDPTDPVDMIDTVEGDSEPRFGMEDLGVDKSGTPVTIDAKDAHEDGEILAPEGANLDPEQPAEEPTNALEEYFKQFEEPEQKGEESGGENSRIDEIVAQKDAQMGQLQNQFQTMQQQMVASYRDLQTNLQQIREENIRYKTLLESNTQQRKSDEEEDPTELFRQKVLADAEQKFKEQLSPVQQELENYKRQAAEQEKQFKRKQAQQKYSEEADQAIKDVLIPLVDDETRVMSPELKEMVLAKAYGHNCSFEEAAQMVRDTMMKYARGFMRASSSKSKEAIKSGKKVPAPVPNRGTSSAKPKPSHAQVTKAGFGNYLEWMMAGSPPIER